MGRANAREYRVWDATEETALRSGVKKHGLGAWERIRTDPDFHVLAHRTGVQLKDKWRNLVKFRHISADETQSLQPKTSGPWHKKYWAAAAAGKTGLGTSTGVAAAAAEAAAAAAGGVGAAAAAGGGGSVGINRSRPRRQQQEPETTDEEDAEEELEAAMGELPQRKSARSVRRRNFADLEEPPPEDDDSWEIGDDSESERLGLPGGSRKRRRPSLAPGGGPAEDRRFGIYDQRRYSSSKQQRSEQGDELPLPPQLQPNPLQLLSLVAPPSIASRRAALVAAAAAAGGADAAAAGGAGGEPAAAGLQPGHHRASAHSHGHLGVSAGRYAAGAAAAAAAAAAEEAGLLPEPGPGAAAAAAAASEEIEDDEGVAGEEADDTYIVECPCGIQYDDGHLMIECEHCKAWAHTACLQAQMESDPHQHSYDFMHYICWKCQQLQLQHTGTASARAAAAGAAAAAAAIAAAAAAAQLSGSSGAASHQDHGAAVAAAAAAAVAAATAASGGSSCDAAAGGPPGGLRAPSPLASLGLGRSLTPCLPGSQTIFGMLPPQGWPLPDDFGSMGGAGGVAQGLGFNSGLTQGFLDAAGAEDLLQPSQLQPSQVQPLSEPLPLFQQLPSQQQGLEHEDAAAAAAAAGGSMDWHRGRAEPGAGLDPQLGRGATPAAVHGRSALAGAGFSSGALAAAEGLASMAQGGRAVAQRVPSPGDEQQHQPQYPHQQQQQQQLVGEAGGSAGAGGTVELDPVLQLYLQGSLQVKRGQRTPRCSSDGTWGQGFMEPEQQQQQAYKQQQQQHGDTWQPEQAIAAALSGRSRGLGFPMGASNSGAAAATASTAAAARSSSVPVSAANGTAVQRSVARKSPVKTQPQRLAESLPQPPVQLLQAAFAGGSRPAPAPAPAPHTAAAAGRGRAAGPVGAHAAVTPAAAAAAAAAGEEVLPPRPGSSLGRHSAGDLLHQALHHHQRELGALLNGSGGSAGALNPAVASAGQQQQAMQQPAQLSSFAEQFLQQQQQSRAGTPLWQTGQPQVSFGGMQQHRRSDGGDTATWDGLRPAADSPALLVHAPGMDRREPFGLLGSSLLGSTFSQLYPAMLGLTSGTPPLPPLDSRPGTPNAAAAAAAAAVAAMAAGAAAAVARAHSRSPAITPRGPHGGPMTGQQQALSNLSGKQSPALSGQLLGGEAISRHASAAAAAAAAAAMAAAAGAAGATTGCDLRGMLPAVAAAAAAAAAAGGGGLDGLQGGGEPRPVTPMDIAALFRTATPENLLLQYAPPPAAAAAAGQAGQPQQPPTAAVQAPSFGMQAPAAAAAAAAAAAFAVPAGSGSGLMPHAAEDEGREGLRQQSGTGQQQQLPLQQDAGDSRRGLADHQHSADGQHRPDAPALDLLAGAVAAVEAAGEQGWSPG